ncbi:MAG: alpha/beta fold hydrolase [Candidatus Zixiibacteriota bacterium]
MSKHFTATIVFVLGLMLPSQPARGFQSGETGYVEVPDGQLYYEVAGQGPTMIMLHDGLIHSAVWNHQWENCANRFTMIRYDRRGFGKSPVPTKPYSNVDDLLTLFEKLGIDSAIVIGMSAGARLALDFAVEHQDRITHLILVSPVVRGLPLTDHFLTRGGHQDPAIFSDPVLLLNYYLDEDPYEIYSGNPQVREEAHTLMEGYLNNVDQIFNRLEQAPSYTTLDSLDELDIPALIISGEYDLPDIHANAGAIAAGIRGSERVVLKDCAHRIPMEQPELLSQTVIGFLSGREFFRVMNASGVKPAVNLYRSMHKRDPGIDILSENRLNRMGYEYLLAGKLEDALELFQLNVDLYPQSANVYDSYAEALLAAGDTTGSVANYQKSLKLNPENTNASTALTRLRPGQ